MFIWNVINVVNVLNVINVVFHITDSVKLDML